MQVRLNKFLSRAGVASRRDADRMIEQGLVRVNSKVVTQLGYKIDDEKDKVEVGRRRVKKGEGLVYLMLNKPRGCLVTVEDPFRRPTVMKLLPRLKKRIFPVGRLDYDSEGLLLLTNDGELDLRLTHPRYGVRKTYLVKVKGDPEPSELAVLEKGIYLDRKKTAPARIERLARSSKSTLLRVEIHEGRKRELKRMFQAIGYEVVRLKRLGFGELKLGKLKRGEWRFLTPKEVEVLKRPKEKN
jgi:pseudouridine synthase